jgi:hypothetical protein
MTLMTHGTMTTVLTLAGWAQASILIAAIQVPTLLRWRHELQPLPRVHRQMHWAYSGFVVLSIIAFASISVLFADELAHGGGLARGLCAYIAIFWCFRLGLAAVFEIRPYLDTWWKLAGYAALTLLFAGLTVVYGVASVRPV